MNTLLAVVSILIHYNQFGYAFSSVLRGYGDSNTGYNNNGYSSRSGNYGVITAAVKSIRNVRVNPLDLPQDLIHPSVIQVPSVNMPVKIVYRSKSSDVNVFQNHLQGAPGQTEATKSEEEPHKVLHEVVRPVIQELREVIVPYRRVVQEIQPVVEEIKTVVARGEGRANQGYNQEIIQETNQETDQVIYPPIIQGINQGSGTGLGRLGGVLKGIKQYSNNRGGGYNVDEVRYYRD